MRRMVTVAYYGAGHYRQVTGVRPKRGKRSEAEARPSRGEIWGKNSLARCSHNKALA
jgi:hypothetical protein